MVFLILGFLSLGKRCWICGTLFLFSYYVCFMWKFSRKWRALVNFSRFLFVHLWFYDYGFSQFGLKVLDLWNPFSYLKLNANSFIFVCVWIFLQEMRSLAKKLYFSWLLTFEFPYVCFSYCRIHLIILKKGCLIWGC